MLTLDQIRQIRTILASDRLKVGGHEVVPVANLLTALQNEENQMAMAARQKPVELTP